MCALLIVPLLILAASPHHHRTPDAESLHKPYRADALRPVLPGVPGQLELLLPEGSPPWPESVRRSLEDRVRREWRADRAYGGIHTGVGIWLNYPLVTAKLGSRVVVPIVDGDELPIEGRLELAEGVGARRVIILLDASSSANARTPFAGPDGETELISVIEAELRALEHLLDLLDDEWLEFGVVAFGEGTWPVAEPGLSVAAMRARLERFRSEHPKGEGRTDAICALWTAVDWLDDTPRGVDREILMLTDGDLPHSGRFTNCGAARSRDARKVCESRINRTTCPAAHRLRQSDGRSDLIQMSRFGRRVRKKVRVSPMVFEPDRSAWAYRRLAEDTGGRLVRVSSAQEIEVALPPLVAGRIQGVYATNVTSGERGEDLLEPGGRSFSGALSLEPGANDVEIRVESDRGTAALYRFRVYSERRHLERFLAELREGNRVLADREQVLVEELRGQPRPALRALRIRPEGEPAPPAAAAD